jgi:hypothetical protein
MGKIQVERALTEARAMLALAGSEGAGKEDDA